MKSKRSRTYLVSGLTLALIFVAIILVFRDVLPDIVKDLSTVPFWGVLLLLALGFAYEAMESVLCLVIIHHKKPDCTFIDALRVTFLGVFGNITTLGAGTLPMQSFYLYRRGLDAGSGLGIMASEYVLHKISVLIYATVALLLRRRLAGAERQRPCTLSSDRLCHRRAHRDRAHAALHLG